MNTRTLKPPTPNRIPTHVHAQSKRILLQVFQERINLNACILIFVIAINFVSFSRSWACCLSSD